MHSELLLLNRQILIFMNIYKSKIGIDCILNRLHGELIDCMENSEVNRFGSKSIRKLLFGSYNSEAPIRKLRAKRIYTEADSEALSVVSRSTFERSKYVIDSNRYLAT